MLECWSLLIDLGIGFWFINLYFWGSRFMKNSDLLSTCSYWGLSLIHCVCIISLARPYYESGKRHLCCSFYFWKRLYIVLDRGELTGDIWIKRLYIQTSAIFDCVFNRIGWFCRVWCGLIAANGRTENWPQNCYLLYDSVFN